MKRRRGRFPASSTVSAPGGRLRRPHSIFGLYLSFSGILTFKKADALRAIARDAPPDMILVETDSPYLAPVPHRSTRNEPARVRLTAECLAALKGVALEEIARATTDNFFRLFRKAQPQHAYKT